MRELIDGIHLDGRAIRVDVRDPLPVDWPTLGLATVFRLLDRYPALTRATVARIDGAVPMITLDREEAEHLLGPGGFGVLRSKGAFRQSLARLVQARGDGEGR